MCANGVDHNADIDLLVYMAVWIHMCSCTHWYGPAYVPVRSGMDLHVTRLSIVTHSDGFNLRALPCSYHSLKTLMLLDLSKERVHSCTVSYPRTLGLVYIE